MTPNQTHISTPKRILLSLIICLSVALILSVVYGVRVGVVGHASFESLWYLGIIHFVILRSLVFTLLTAPLAAWALWSYAALKWYFLLFMVLVAWVLLAKTMPGSRLIIFGGLLLSYIGLVAIRLIGQR
jgi:hypothetical protein